MRRITLSVTLGLAALLTVMASMSGAAVASLSLPTPLAVTDKAITLSCGEVVSTQSQIFMPVVLHNYLGVTDDIPSPFALQIAALSLVQPGSMGAVQAGDSPLASMTEAEWEALYGTAFVTLTAALSESGAGWVRVFIKWSQIEPVTPTEGQPPVYHWSWYDSKLGLVAATNVRIIATVGHSPAWAAATACAPIYPDRLDEFVRFMTDLVNRYKQPPYNIKHWEPVNEPDGTWPYLGDGGLGCWGYAGDQYAQMLALAYPAIKAADPEATVLMGGVAHDWFIEYGGPFYRYFPDAVMGAGGGAWMDTITFHYFPDFHAEWERWDPRSKDRRYGWLAPPTCGDLYDGQGSTYNAAGIDLIAKTTHFRNRLATCFGVNKPVWVTELAEHGYPDKPDSLTDQARYVIKGFARGLAAGAQNITWYSLDRPPYDIYEQSLLYRDFSPKPAFYAFKTLTAELTGYEYSRERSSWVYDDSQLGFRYVREAYVFRDAAGREKTVVWGESNQQLDFAANRVRVVDRNGSETFVWDGGAGDADGLQNGVVTLQLSAEPVFVQTAP